MKNLPNFSTDIKAAWTVVDQMASEGWSLILVGFKDEWVAKFWRGVVLHKALGKTPAHAICLAALGVRTSEEKK